MENNTPATERVPAQVAAPQVILPRHKQVERQGDRAEPYVHYHPMVRGGICEWCGVMDKNVESKDQYKLCPHYRGMLLRCSYCPDDKNPDDIARRSVLQVMDSPTEPGTLIVVCDSYDCSKRHIERFKRNV